MLLGPWAQPEPDFLAYLLYLMFIKVHMICKNRCVCALILWPWTGVVLNLGLITKWVMVHNSKETRPQESQAHLYATWAPTWSEQSTISALKVSTKASS